MSNADDPHKTPRDGGPEKSKSARAMTWAMAWLLSAFIGLLLVVPLLSRTGPYVPMECRNAQMELEALAHAVEHWEREHPGSPPLDLEDCQKGYASGHFLNTGDGAFIAWVDDYSSPAFVLEDGGKFNASLAFHYPLHRTGRTPMRIMLDFRRQGRFGIPFIELHSWDRRPMETYIAAHHRGETRYAAMVWAGFALCSVLGACLIVELWNLLGSGKKQ